MFKNYFSISNEGTLLREVYSGNNDDKCSKLFKDILIDDLKKGATIWRYDVAKQGKLGEHHYLIEITTIKNKNSYVMKLGCDNDTVEEVKKIIQPYLK